MLFFYRIVFSNVFGQNFEAFQNFSVFCFRKIRIKKMTDFRGFQNFCYFFASETVNKTIWGSFSRIFKLLEFLLFIVSEKQNIFLGDGFPRIFKIFKKNAVFFFGIFFL